MSMLVYCELAVKTPDGSIQANIANVEMTIQPIPGDMIAEADLAKAKVESMAAELVSKIQQQLTDWGIAAQAAWDSGTQ